MTGLPGRVPRALHRNGRALAKSIKVEEHGHDGFTRPCSARIEREWLPATVNRAEGRVVVPALRDSSTAILHNPELANELYQRVLPHVPACMTSEVDGSRVNLTVAGVHLPLRIYRYTPGQHFGLHQDQSYFGAEGTRSLLTLMVYLNDNFEGGETAFPDQHEIITPKTGNALLLQHRVLHAGNQIRSGVKFVLRSDVLYQPADRP